MLYNAAMPKSPLKKSSVKRVIKCPVEEVSSDGKYDVCVSIGDLIVQTKTDSILETILGIKPVKVMQRVIFKVSGEGKSVEMSVFPLRAKRILFNPLAAQFFVKRLLLSMK